MAPVMKPKVVISQDAFDGAVKENMEDFDMSLAEAVEDAIKTFQMQGANLSGNFFSEIEHRRRIRGIWMVDCLLLDTAKASVTIVKECIFSMYDSLKTYVKERMDGIIVHCDTDGLSVMPIESDLSFSCLPANETTDMPVETNNTTHDQDANSKISETNDLVKDNENVKPPLASSSESVSAGIVTDGSNIGKDDYVHPTVQAVKELEKSLSQLRLEDGKLIDWERKQTEPVRVEALFEAAVDALEHFSELCVKKESENAHIAVKNGGVEVCLDAYQALKTYRLSWGSCALRILHGLLQDDQGKERFHKADGPQIVMEALAIENEELYEAMNREISCTAATVLALAATKNEVLKETFMDLGADEALVRYLKNHAEEMISDGAALQAACDAIRSLIVADDDRPAASKAYRNAMKIAKAGAVDAILAILPQKAKSTPILPTICITLKSLAVNDEICRTIADEGGLDMVLQFLDYTTTYPNKVVARSACALLSQLACSDANKDAIVQSGGLIKIINLMNTYSEEPSVLQEGFAAIATLTLRSPSNATKAVEAGSVDVAVEQMEKHPSAASMLRQACQMIRNLSVRNPENRPLILEKGLEPLLRKAKDTHETCKDVGSAALRDLGLDNYQ